MLYSLTFTPTTTATTAIMASLKPYYSQVVLSSPPSPTVFDYISMPGFYRYMGLHHFSKFIVIALLLFVMASVTCKSRANPISSACAHEETASTLRNRSRSASPQESTLVRRRTGSTRPPSPILEPQDIESQVTIARLRYAHLDKRDKCILVGVLSCVAMFFIVCILSLALGIPPFG